MNIGERILRELYLKLMTLSIGKQLYVPGQNGLPIRIERARSGKSIGWRLIHGKNHFVTNDVKKIMGYLLAYRHRVVAKRPKLRMERIQITDLGNF